MSAKHLLPALFLIYCLSNCTTDPIGNSALNVQLAATIAAHGGWEQWQQFKTLSYALESKSNGKSSGEKFYMDLHSRHEHITGSNYDIGYDGQHYWQLLKDTSVSKKNPSFLINLQFYFFAMPFVLADPGVAVQPLGSKSIGKLNYEVLKITFADGTGVAPKDQYLLYIDPTTKKLEYLLYSVTYFNSENAEKYNALHYSNWQEVNGLLVPKIVKRYAWDNEQEQLGQIRGEKIYSEVVFSADPAEQAQFAMPEGALAD